MTTTNRLMMNPYFEYRAPIMDEFKEAKIINLQALEADHTGPTAELTTQRGAVYHVWIDADGQPLIQRVDGL